MKTHLSGLMLAGPGVRYVPENVWQSRYFWIALVVLIVSILLYKNGFLGKKIKENINENINPVKPKITYTSDGRSGHVHYQSAETRFALYYEFGGGDCIASIAFPSTENWEQQTKLPLEKRDEVLSLIGRQVVKDQTSGGKGYFKIDGNWLSIYV